MPERLCETSPVPARVCGPVLCFLALFTASRIGFALGGLRFCTETVAATMQLVEPDLLRDRLLESLWYLHGQPPLMSVLLGLLLKAFGDGYATALHCVYFGVGAATGAALVALLRRIDWSSATSVALALAYASLPAVLVYEHYAHSTHLVAGVLVCACVPLHAALTGGGLRSWLWFFVAAAVVVNLRNVFHLAWWLARVALAVRLAPRRRLGVLLVALGPLCLAGSWYAKNLYVHGRFEASSWVGFGLARKTWHAAPLEDRRALVQAGLLDPIAAVPLFGTVDEYAAVLGMPPETGVPLLDRKTKAAGTTNFHHAIYADASRRMRDEALRVIAADPGRYLANVARTVRQLFAASATWPAVATPRGQVAAYEQAVDRVLHGELGVPSVNLWSLLAAAVLVPGLVIAFRALARPSAAPGADRLLVFLVATILYLYVAAVLLETNEVMRLRLKVDGLLLLAGAIVARRLKARFSESSARTHRPLLAAWDR